MHYISKKKRSYEDLSQEEKQDLIDKYPYMTDKEIFKETAINTKSELVEFIDMAYEENGVLLEKSSLDIVKNDDGDVSILGIVLADLDEGISNLALEMRKSDLDPIEVIDDVLVLQLLRAKEWIPFEKEIGTPSEDVQAILQHIGQLAGQKHKIQEGIKVQGNIQHTLVGLVDELDDDDEDDFIDAEYEVKE